MTLIYRVCVCVCVCRYEYFILLSLLQCSDLESKKKKFLIYIMLFPSNIFTKHNTNKILIVKLKGIFTITARHETHIGTGIERGSTIDMPQLISCCAKHTKKKLNSMAATTNTGMSPPALSLNMLLLQIIRRVPGAPHFTQPLYGAH